MRVFSIVVMAVLAAGLFIACSQQQEMSDSEYAERMAREHEGDSPVAGASSLEGPPSNEVETMTVNYATVDGQDIQGYLARPVGTEGGLPGIIVIHEWWGLNDNIHAMAEKLAGEGYTALAVDLYNGRVAQDSEQAQAYMQSAMENPEAAQENLRQAYTYLEAEQNAPKIGTIGWCFGGGWSLNTALMLPSDVDATVIYYGRLITDPEQLKTLEMPILGIFGAEDQGIPPETVKQFENALKSLDKKASIYVYEGADHAFANPSGTRYNAEAAADAWRKTLAFFETNLK